MNPLAHALPRGRFGRGALTVATIVALAAGTLPATTNAHASSEPAESGRRICEYSFKAHPRHYHDPLMRISLGMDYKKKGACPTVSPVRLASTGLADYDQIYPNPVHKWTCEDWGRTHQTYLNALGADPCPKLTDDRIYAFFWQDPTTPDAPKPTYAVVGPWQHFAP